MDKVLVKSTYNIKFHYKFYSFHLFRKSFTLYIFLLAGAVSIYLALKNTFTAEVPLATKITSWVMVLLIMTFIPFFALGRIRGIVKKNQRERKDNQEIIEFTRFKITRVIENITSREIVGWEIFESVYEFKDVFMLYIDKERGLVVPKEDIVEGSSEILEKLIKNNLKPDKKGKIRFKKMYKE